MSDVFVSYSRQDRTVVESIVNALRAAGEKVWVDLSDIAKSSVWMEEIRSAIANADSIVFFISPDSVTSEVCRDELNYAVELSKRLVPVVVRETLVEAVPAPLPDINWHFVRPETFDSDVAELVEVLNTDIARVHMHTRLLVRASEWETRGGDKSVLLRGTELAEAQDWLAGQTDQKPTTTPVQGRFIAASRRAATHRQRSAVLVGTAVVTVMAIIAAVAVVQWRSATVQRDEAQKRFREATVGRLVSEAKAMLADITPGGDDQAFKKLLAAYRIETTDTPAPDPWPIRDALAVTASTAKIIETPGAGDFAALSPDGRILARARDDHSIRRYDSSTGQPIGEPSTGHTDTVFNVRFSADGTLLASGSLDTTIRLWNAESGAPVGDPLIGHDGAVLRVAFSPDGRVLASASRDGTARLWDIRTGQPIGPPLIGHTVDGLTAYVHDVEFSPDGHLLATAGADGSVRLWNAVTGRPDGEPLTGYAGRVIALAFSPDGRRLATGSGGADFSVWIWDLQSRQPIAKDVGGQNNTVSDLIFSPDGTRLVSSSLDQTVAVRDGSTAEMICVPLMGHGDRVHSVTFTPGANEIVSGGGDYTVRRWDFRASCLVNTPGMGTAAFDLARETIYTGDDQGTIRVWDLETGSPKGQPFSIGGQGPMGISVSPDGKTLASIGEGRLRLWNVVTRQQIGPPLMQDAVINTVAFSPTGDRVAAGGVDFLRIWDVHTGALQHEAPIERLNTLAMAFSTDGSRIVIGNEGPTVRVLDARDAGWLGEPLLGHEGPILSMVLSPDGRTLATGGFDQSVRLWNIDTMEALGELTGHTDAVFSLAFSPDGRVLASGSFDRTLRLWDVESQRQIGSPMTGHTRMVVKGLGQRGTRVVGQQSRKFHEALRAAPITELSIRKFRDSPVADSGKTWHARSPCWRVDPQTLIECASPQHTPKHLKMKICG